ncbi:MAG: HEPN domain-containing protein [Desulfosporosinus sp.]|nr:HEPN domain-containing protein [Desulfosporosinus sp.]
MEISSLCRRWLEFAADDLTAAKHLLSLYLFRLEIICYHCEQFAEKMLKAFLLMHDEEAPRIHDLVELCRLCALNGIALTLRKCKI